MKRRGISFLSALVMSGGILFATAHPASAQTNIKICNSSASAGPIQAYKTDYSWADTLAPDECSAWVNNTGSNPVRVDTGFGTKSYKLGVIGQGYGPCHSGYNPASNPPDDAPDGVRYRNYGQSTAC